MAAKTAFKIKTLLSVFLQTPQMALLVIQLKVTKKCHIIAFCAINVPTFNRIVRIIDY